MLMRATLFFCNRQNLDRTLIAALVGTLKDNHYFDKFAISYATDAGLPMTEELVFEGREIVTPSSGVQIAGPAMFEDYWTSLLEGEDYFGDYNSQGAIEVLRQVH
jgi:hypothetical protein